MIDLRPLAEMLGTRFGRVLPLRVGIGFLVLALTLIAAVHGAVDALRLDDVHGRRPGLRLRHARCARVRLLLARETGVASGMNTIMRTVGAALGAQVAGRGDRREHRGRRAAPARARVHDRVRISACGALEALAPTLLLGGVRVRT